MIRLRGREAAIVLSVAALAAAGCGSSSKSTSKSGTQATSTAGTSTTASNGYTREVDAAVAPLIGAIQGARSNPLNASAWDQVSKTAGPARDKVAALKPPGAVASLHPQLVTLLGAISSDAAAARDAINNNDRAAERAAGQKVASDGGKLQALAARFRAAGYPI